MPHPCVGATATTLQQLRRAAIATEVEQNAPISPNIFFSWDVLEGGASVSLRSEPGLLLTADVRVRGMPRWLTLSIGLGAGHFAERQTLGLAIRAACTVGFELAPFIRSTQDGDKQDTILSDTCHLQPVARTSVLLHSIMPREALTRAGDNHTLILPLPKQDFTLDLHDMRLFHIERPDNTAAPRRTITSVAY